MNVLQRNFFRLLRSGTFGSKEQLEPLSTWKWDKLYRLSLMHGVAALIYDGMMVMKDDFFLQLTDAQWALWKKTVAETENQNKETDIQLSEVFTHLNKEKLRPMLLKGQSFAQFYPVPSHRTAGDVDIFFPYDSLAKKADQWAKEHGKVDEGNEKNSLVYQMGAVKVEHRRTLLSLTNPLLNKRLQNIISKETRCCDSCYAYVNGTKVECLPNNINLLTMLVRISRYMLNDGISLKQIIDLGMFLRKQGDKVDYVLMQKWLAKLQLQPMAQLIGGLLIALFNFSPDEIPFMDKHKTIATDIILNEVFRLSGAHAYDWYFTQGKDIFVRASNSNAMFWQMRHSVRYFRYCPAESVTNFLSSFAHSLSHIEE